MLIVGVAIAFTSVLSGFVYRFCKYYYVKKEKYYDDNPVKTLPLPKIMKTPSSCESNSDSESQKSTSEVSSSRNTSSDSITKPRSFRPFKASFSRERSRARSLTPSTRSELVSQLSTVSVISIPEFIPENLSPEILEGKIESNRCRLTLGQNSLPPLGSPGNESKSKALPIVVTVTTSSEDDHF